MLLDRGLTLELLEIAFDVAVADPDSRTNRRKLTIALRDHVSEQEAEGKTKKCLTRVWLNPPAEAVDMIAWARLQDFPQPMRPVLHFGAILATFPFVGTVAKVVGQHLKTDGHVSALAVRAEVRRLLGDRSSVDVAARKAYTTFRNLGLLQQEGQVLRPAGRSFVVSNPLLSAWLGHAVLLTRQVESQPLSMLTNAPELLGIELPAMRVGNYPLVESHSQIGSPLVARKEAEPRRVASGVAGG